MMKIAIVTLFGFSNYGNRLQNYALQEAIKTEGHDVTSLVANSSKEILKSKVKSFITRQNGKISLVPQFERIRENNIKSFSEQYITSQLIIRKDRKFDLSLEDQFDCFVVGSDQVWNPLFWEKEGFERSANNYLLQFVRDKKKIAYAASFGIPDIPEKYHTLFKDALSRFDMVTLREEIGLQIVKDLVGLDTRVVLDPTMLLSAEKWRSIEPGTVNTKRKYVVLYFLGKQSKQIYDEIWHFARKNDAEIIDMMDESNKDIYTMGPEAFIEYIDKAMMCFTDSFHATVFSILFHTPFITYDRKHANNSNMNSRIETLLGKFNLKHRLYRGSESLQEMFVDYSEADGILNFEKEQSLNVLNEALTVE